MLIGICEDDQAIRNQIKQYIQTEPEEHILCEYSSGEELLASNNVYDLIFLDIELQGQLSGIDVARTLQNNQTDTIIVFVSGYTKYVSSAFHLRTFQFLLKPIEENLFREEFRRCVEHYCREHAVFEVNQNGEIIKVELKDIKYLEANKRKLIVHDRWGKYYETYGKISEQETKLELHGFIRTHKSFLVNCKYIQKLTNEAVQLKGHMKEETDLIPLSRLYRDAARRKYHSSFFKE